MERRGTADRNALTALLAAAAFLYPSICSADPVAQQLTVNNAGPTTIVRLSATPVQGQRPLEVYQVKPAWQSVQPFHPFVMQPVVMPATQSCTYDIQALYVDGRTVAISNWNVCNTPTITIRR